VLFEKPEYFEKKAA